MDNLTQEEFEIIVNKTCELSLTHSSDAAVNFWKLHDKGTIEIEDLSDIMWIEVFFTPFDSNLKTVAKALPSANALYIYWLTRDEGDICEEFPFVIGESTNRNQALIFATSNLDDIKRLVKAEDNDPNELFEEDIGDCVYASPWFLLVNPRNEVVEWALDVFDYKSQPNIHLELDFVESRQAIPQIKELILNTLEKKGE